MNLILHDINEFHSEFKLNVIRINKFHYQNIDNYNVFNNVMSDNNI